MLFLCEFRQLHACLHDTANIQTPGKRPGSYLEGMAALKRGKIAQKSSRLGHGSGVMKVPDKIMVHTLNYFKAGDHVKT